MRGNFEWEIGQVTSNLELNKNIQPYYGAFEISIILQV